jgi:hypothetical protein
VLLLSNLSLGSVYYYYTIYARDVVFFSLLFLPIALLPILVDSSDYPLDFSSGMENGCARVQSRSEIIIYILYLLLILRVSLRFFSIYIL